MVRESDFRGEAATQSASLIVRSSFRAPRRAIAKPQSVTQATLQTAFASADARSFFGFAVDRDDLARKFIIEILVDGYPIKAVRADSLVHELARDRVGDGCYGFSLTLDEAIANDAAVVEARLANLGTPIGAPIALDRLPDAEIGPDQPGQVHWIGGLHFSGWIGEDAQQAPLTALVDAIPVAQIRSSSWRHHGTDENVRPVRAFDFHLPHRFADGCVHQLSLLNGRHEHLDGSPSVFLALPGAPPETSADGDDHGSRRVDSRSERPAGELLDRLAPTSAPFSQYEAWRRKFLIASSPRLETRIAFVMVGATRTDDTLDSLQEQTHSDWVAASLPPTPIATGFRPGQLHAFLNAEAAQSEIVAFGLAGTLLAPTALERIANAFAAHERAIAVYGDFEIQGPDGSIWPLALSAFDYERLLEQGYCAHLFAVRRSALQHALAAGAANLYRLFNALLDDDSGAGSDIVHLPGALGVLPAFDMAMASAALAEASRAHRQRRGARADARPIATTTLPGVRIARLFDPPRTTLVIPARNQRFALQRCLSSVLPAAKRIDAEILVVDNDCTDPSTLDYLNEIEGRIARVLRVPGDFNAARLMNRAAEAATGDVLCLLNCDVKARDDEWLKEMLSRIVDADVGAVGALLSWPTEVVQHGGVVLGPNFAAANAFSDRMAADSGYCDLLRVSRECSAVSGACLVTRRRDYGDVGGFDELRFPAYFSDVDFCLKLRALGKRIVFTPHARLDRFGPAARGASRQIGRDELFEAEIRNLRNKWGRALAIDPYYNPTLSLDPVPFSALAWPVRDLSARMNEPPIAIAAPAGF
jgi:GT2 family glycosyltransferase